MAICTDDGEVFERAYGLLQKRVKGLDMVTLAQALSTRSIRVSEVEAATFASEMPGAFKHTCLFAKYKLSAAFDPEVKEQPSSSFDVCEVGDFDITYRADRRPWHRPDSELPDLLPLRFANSENASTLTAGNL